MITFEINPFDENYRCDKYYLTSILLAEIIIKKLKPNKDLHYSFDFILDDDSAKLKVCYNSDNSFTFGETIASEINSNLSIMWKNILPNSYDSYKIANDVKEFLDIYPRTLGMVSNRKLSVHQLLDELTPFALEENISYQRNLPSKYKLAILLMAIYGKQIPSDMAQNVLDLLEQEL